MTLIRQLVRSKNSGDGIGPQLLRVLNSGGYSRLRQKLDDHLVHENDEQVATARALCLACEADEEEVDHLNQEIRRIEEQQQAKKQALLYSLESIRNAEGQIPADRNRTWNQKHPNSLAWSGIRKLLPESSQVRQLPPAVETAAIRKSESESENSQPTLYIYMLGEFRVYCDDTIIEGWPRCKAKSVFKYLAIHRRKPIPKEVLMDLFWPNSDSRAARNSLNVAIYNLRQALRVDDQTLTPIIFKDDCYLFNPEFSIYLDIEEFEARIKEAGILDGRGESEAAIASYEAAVSLYGGELFPDDRYEDWLMFHRRELEESYLSVLEHLNTHFFADENYEACIQMSGKLLGVDACNEEAHRLRMRCFCRSGQLHLAVRQYHHCVDALKRGLQMSPCLETVQLYKKLKRREII